MNKSAGASTGVSAVPTDERPTTYSDQVAVPCVLMRGGTSKALFFLEHDVPPAGSTRDRFLQRAMGSPGPAQIDGLGGSTLSTSKAALIQRSSRLDADVDYTFAQIDVEHGTVSYAGNCGNISSAVGPFAVDEGLVSAVEPQTTVRIYNTNTSTVLVALVSVADGKARVQGNCAIAGVPGTGAEIQMDYSSTVGSSSGQLLPTGNVVDMIPLEDGRIIPVTVCDVSNPCVFVPAAALGLTGSELPAAISADRRLVETTEEIRLKAGQMSGLLPDWRVQRPPTMPMLVLIAPPAEYVDMNGRPQPAATMDVQARLLTLGTCHSSMAGTGLICTAAASKVAGSVVNEAADSAKLSGGSLRIGHPLGVTEVGVTVARSEDPHRLAFATLGLARTARRLMAGSVYLPGDFEESDQGSG